jgi:hypothetical protein
MSARYMSAGCVSARYMPNGCMSAGCVSAAMTTWMAGS